MTDEINNTLLSQDELDALIDSVPQVEVNMGASVPAASSPKAVPSEGSNPGATTPSVDSPHGSIGSGSVAPATLRMASFDDPGTYTNTGSALQGFDRVQDIPLELTVELGRTKLLIRDVLELGTGSIIELEKMAGEPVDLLANGLLIARGEVVVIEDNFGVRITEIITSSERKIIAEDPMNQTAAA